MEDQDSYDAGLPTDKFEAIEDDLENLDKRLSLLYRLVQEVDQKTNILRDLIMSSRHVKNEIKPNNE